MSVRLVFIGAAAEAAPAASLRALAGGGAVFVPPDLDAELLELVAGAAGVPPAALRGLVPADLAELDRHGDPTPGASVPPAGGAGPATTGPVVCIAGPRGPVLARAALAAAARGELSVETVPSAAVFGDLLVAAELASLRRIVAILRHECPWDREQTAADIIRYTVEEVYELAEAIGRDDVAAEHGELGDLLLQVYLLALFLEERDLGDLGTVAQAIEVKLIRRHAHIFGDAVAETAEEVRGQWERIKREQEGREGIFHDVPSSFPALLYARKLQERAAAVGFDWPTVAEAFPKIAEEHGELAEVLLGVGDAPPAHHLDPRLAHEFGDLLFATVNVARLAKVDPELALRGAAQRFEDRVCAAAALANGEGVDWSALGLAEQEYYYQRAKAAASGGRP
jgi:MazG family protein